MKEAQIIKAYEAAKERYAQIGIDTDEALKKCRISPSRCTAGRRMT